MLDALAAAGSAGYHMPTRGYKITRKCYRIWVEGVPTQARLPHPWVFHGLVVPQMNRVLSAMQGNMTCTIRRWTAL